jgi:hypothetical protein
MSATTHGLFYSRATAHGISNVSAPTAERVRLRVTPAVTQDIDVRGFIGRNAPFSR